jgi:hypothetical protein
MKYRKKPVVIEAFQMTLERHDNNVDWPEWLNRAWQQAETQPGALVSVVAARGNLAIVTLEGQMLVSVDDWIIQGVKGEIYPCKPDIFAATYDAVEATPA